MEDLDQLVVAAADDDEHAWRRLWASIHPPLSRLVAQPRFLGSHEACDEDREHIVAAVHARLRAGRFHRLHLYLEAKRANPRLRFASWLRVVAQRAGLDYVHARMAELS
jgi:hypothetical protein